MSRSYKSDRDRPADLPCDPESGTGEWVLACRICCREVTAEPADLNRYLSDGWPKCCGRDMIASIRQAGD